MIAVVIGFVFACVGAIGALIALDVRDQPEALAAAAGRHRMVKKPAVAGPAEGATDFRDYFVA